MQPEEESSRDTSLNSRLVCCLRLNPSVYQYWTIRAAVVVSTRWHKHIRKRSALSLSRHYRKS
jgi:hypothetical protein